MLAKLTTIRAFMLLLVLVCTLPAIAQKRISGKVTSSEDGLPLVGVTVSVTGTNIATQTNTEGIFSLSAPENATRLTISSVGFESQVLSLDGRTDLSVKLVGSSRELNEVVVTSLGIERKTKAL